MSWLTRLRNSARGTGTRRDIDREIAFHIAERADDLEAAGLSPEDASRRARLQFGNVTLETERTRDVDVLRWVDLLRLNLRYAMRMLTRSPGFAFTVVATVALGVGANSAVFSVVNAVLLRPLPFPDGDRLMRLSQTQERSAETNIAPSRLEDWNRLNTTFAAITGYYVEDESETSGDLPERIRRAWVAPRFLEVWGIAPRLGRAFTDAEHTGGGPLAVLISDRYWHRRFGADAGVVGRTIRIGRASFPIVGVMPADFMFPDRQVDVWVPVTMSPFVAQLRQATWYVGIGRLKAGVTPEQARTNLSVVQAQLAERYPDTDRKLGVNVVPLKEVTIGGIRASLWLVYGGVTILLLITCTNIAALLLSRATQRHHELAVRVSLGASRAAVAVQVLTESAVLAAIGGAIGLAANAAALSLVRAAAADLPRVEEIAIDYRILLYTFATTIGVALLCGLLPAMRTARGRTNAVTGGGLRTQVSGRSAVQWALVAAQVALSVTLLAGAALLVRSLQELSRVNPGFEPSHVLTFRLSANWSESAQYDRVLRRIEATIDQLRAMPGVAAASSALFPPGVPAQYESTFELAEAAGDADRRLVAEGRMVSPEYFATMQIAVVGGETCTRQPMDTPREVMVNRSFAARYLSGRPSAIGLHVTTGAPGSRPARIVGIVSDARERGLDRDPGPVVYTCFSAPNPAPYFLVRTTADPESVAQAVRFRMKQLEPFRAVYDLTPLEARIGAAYNQNRLRTRLLSSFAVTAFVLACVGLYGTLGYVLTRRRREIGLRMALGAARGDIVRHFLLHVLRIVAAAAVAGAALAIASAQFLSGMLYGVSPADPWSLAAVVAGVVAVTTLAALVPVARAALVAPMLALREE
jgi:putative ABC transport system permease protein